MTRWIRSCAAATALGAVCALPALAQGTASVSGQVRILERPGEVTEDLSDVVVYLEPVAGSVGTGAASRAPSPALTNTDILLRSRQFQPRVRAVTSGSTVAFRNEDPFSHNVFSKTNGGFDTGVYGRGKSRETVFREPGVYALYCNVHPRMTAFVITLATPYFTQAEQNGTFSIAGVPPGRYTLHVWHDRANGDARDVTVPSGGVANLRVQLDATAYRYVQHKNKFGQDYATAAGDRY